MKNIEQTPRPLGLVLWALAFVLLCSRQASHAEVAGYEIDSDWPRVPVADWGEVPGLAVDADDNVWVFHRGPEPLQLFSNSGDRLAHGFKPKVEKPHQVRVFGGEVWLVDQGRHVVERYGVRPTLTLGVSGEAGEDEAHFNQPTDVAIGKGGDIYVTDGYINSRVVQFDADGTYKRTWGKKGSGEGEFSLPHAIVADSKGRLYVADRSNQRVQVFDPEGNFISQWDHILPWGMWITEDDEIYICGSSPVDPSSLSFVEKGFARAGMLGIPPRNQVVMRFSTDGTLEKRWDIGHTKWVHGIAVDSEGNLFLSGIQDHRVQKFTDLRE